MRRLRNVFLLVVSAAAIACGLPAVNRDRSETTTPRHCPYDFQSHMPPGVYCVYRGTAHAPDGTLCADDLVVIWSAYDGAGMPGPRRNGALAEGHEVYFGLVGKPVLVVRAVAAHEERARLLEYQLGSKIEPLPLDGFTALIRPDRGSARLRLAIRPPDEVPGPACAFALYEGAFIGVIGDSTAGSPRGRH